MRSMTDLQMIAGNAGIDAKGMTREQVMDAIRETTGTFDPGLQIDPMKAKDLKNEIDWSRPGVERFKGLDALTKFPCVVEPKIDGARARLFLGAKGNTMNGGRRSDTTYAYIERADNFPHLRDCVNPVLAGTIIDCEIVMDKPVETAPGDFTVGTLNSVMAVWNCKPGLAVARQEKHGKARLIAFDILAVQGSSCMDKTLAERRELLETVVKALRCEHIEVIPQFPATPENVQQCLDHGFEGAMVKRLAGRYAPGKRSADWLKIKKMSTGDFFIIGSTPGTGRNEGKVGSLKVAYWADTTDAEGGGKPNGEPVYCADVRGFDDAMCEQITDPETGGVRAEFIGSVIEVMGQGRTKNERIRHPHFIRWRQDKNFRDCGRDQIELFEVV